MSASLIRGNSNLEETMGQRVDTSKENSNNNFELLAEQLNELRKLRKLVRKAEAKKRQDYRMLRASAHRSEVPRPRTQGK